jgi:hypothetical protein
MDDGKKVKHGQGKIIFPGINNAHGNQVGDEEYDGQWNDDQMHGYGTYRFTSGNVYTGNWENGLMNGNGKMEYCDGSVYDGEWTNNLMNGEGIYVDRDRIKWTGIFVNGQFDSKIQKKLKTEKVVKDKIATFEKASRVFFSQFSEAFSKSDKKTFKDNLMQFFGTNEVCNDFVNLDVFPKYEDRAPDKWNEALKNVNEDPNIIVKALGQKDESKIINPELVLVEMLRPKPGGQLVEIKGANFNLVLCQLHNENWVLVHFIAEA